MDLLLISAEVFTRQLQGAGEVEQLCDAEVFGSWTCIDFLLMKQQCKMLQ